MTERIEVLEIMARFWREQLNVIGDPNIDENLKTMRVNAATTAQAVSVRLTEGMSTENVTMAPFNNT